MLVVIGMITIVTAVAIPSLRGLFEDFRINQTVQEADTLISSYRSYYLIMNEFPQDAGAGVLSNIKDGWCFPRNLYTASSRRFTIQPYKGTAFDFEEWSTLNTSIRVEARKKQDAIVLNISGLSDAAVTEKYKTKFSNLYPKNTLPMDGKEKLGIIFPEITKEFCESEPDPHRNRYR